MKVSQDINTNAGESFKLKNRKINPNNIIWDAYINTCEKDLIIFDQKIDNLYNNPSINSLNEFVYKLSCTLQKNATILSTNSKPHVITNVPPIRNNHRNLVNDIDTDTSTLYSNYIQQQKDRWNSVWKQNNSKEIWNQINWKGELTPIIKQISLPLIL